ncbi:hypothetical protein Pelo_11557 [Pelomyxa schiedti]|nr:hypothetical protein Pelo_11557 [Pelomyxa schiedti]
MARRTLTTELDGWLVKKGLHLRKHWYYLADDGYTWHCSKTNIAPKSTESIDLRSVSKVEAEKDDVFQIVTHQRSYEFKAGSAEEMRRWVKAIQTQVLAVSVDTGNTGDEVQAALLSKDMEINNLRLQCSTKDTELLLMKQELAATKQELAAARQQLASLHDIQQHQSSAVEKERSISSSLLESNAKLSEQMQVCQTQQKALTDTENEKRKLMDINDVFHSQIETLSNELVELHIQNDNLRCRAAYAENLLKERVTMANEAISTAQKTLHPLLTEHVDPINKPMAEKIAAYQAHSAILAGEMERLQTELQVKEEHVSRVEKLLATRAITSTTTTTSSTETPHHTEGSPNTDDTRRELESYKKKYFIALGKSIKIQSALVGLEPNVDLDALYQRCTAENVEPETWPLWIVDVFKNS